MAPYSEFTTARNYDAWYPEYWTIPVGYKTTQQKYTTTRSCWEVIFDEFNNDYTMKYVSWLEFDFDDDGIVDTTYDEAYLAKEGPNKKVGELL